MDGFGPPRRKPRVAYPSPTKLPPPTRYVYPFRQVEEVLKRTVWSKAALIDGCDPAAIRRDSMGSIIVYHDHGNCSSQFGWEIDHIIPRAANGSSEIYNLQPLQWQNNRRKGDRLGVPIRPRWSQFLRGR